MNLLHPGTLYKCSATGETRSKELTPLMIACMMGQLDSVKLLISEARKRLNKEQLNLFINIKVVKEMGGNNALLYACFTQNTNQ